MVLVELGRRARRIDSARIPSPRARAPSVSTMRVDVIALDAEVDDAEPAPPLRRPERAVDDGERSLAAEVPDRIGDTERHVDRLVGGERLSRLVRHGAALARGRPSRAPALSAPGREDER